jgi:hypothetical protein
MLVQFGPSLRALGPQATASSNAAHETMMLLRMEAPNVPYQARSVKHQTPFIGRTVGPKHMKLIEFVIESTPRQTMSLASCACDPQAMQHFVNRHSIDTCSACRGRNIAVKLR